MLKKTSVNGRRSSLAGSFSASPVEHWLVIASPCKMRIIYQRRGFSAKSLESSLLLTIMRHRTNVWSINGRTEQGLDCDKFEGPGSKELK